MGKSKVEFTGSPSQIRTMYGSGKGIKEIMDATGEDYEAVKNALEATRTRLTTGGPHNTSKCRHNH